MSIEPFNRLVKFAAKAFYDDITIKSGKRSDNRGIAVVVLDALTRRQWVREEDLANDLKLHSKQLRRTLRFFEEEKFITRDHRKEGAAKEEGDDDKKIKMHTHSYCCLDYAQIHDVVRYRLRRMKKQLRDELDKRNTVQEYVCPKPYCGKRYTALDALGLISPEDDYFHCESCNGELVEESARGTTIDPEKLEDMLHRMEAQFKPLMDQLNRVKDLPAPEFGSLQAWEVRANAVARGADGDPSKSGGTVPMPYFGETKIEVEFSSGLDEKGDNIIKSEVSATTPMKALPPWMIKEGMVLTKEQRGEIKQEANMEGTSAAAVGSSDDKKSTGEVVRGNIHDEYVKQYYDDIYPEYNTSTERQLGVKSKREDEDVDWEDIEWEEAPPAGDDDIEWEEG